MGIRFDYSYAGLGEEEFLNKLSQLRLVDQELAKKTGTGHDFLGWYDYPVNYDIDEFERIKKSAAWIRKNCDAFVIIGIGGSYLGSKAVISALTSTYFNELPAEKRGGPKVYFAGENISGTELADLVDLIKDQDLCVNVISKSGTTTEPAIAFRILKDLLEEKYGKDGAKDRIFASTDKERGALKFLADQEGYESFVIPDDVGGRFSVHSAVGLLPLAAAGVNIDDFMAGAKEGYREYQAESLADNTCYQYALYRHLLYMKGMVMEVLVDYEPALMYFAEWWKQLYAESEGKDGKGVFPVSVHFSTDLHSVGQMIQEGKNNLYETVIMVDEMAGGIKVKTADSDLDGLNYLAGKTLEEINEKAFCGTLLAHVDGGVPNGIFHLAKLDAFHLGKLIYLFEKACGLCGYLLGVNPFNQPGVEAYKRNMFALLGKPGYEDLGEVLKTRLKK